MLRTVQIDGGSVNRSDIARQLASDIGVTYPEAQDILSKVFGMIEVSLCAGEDVQIRNFGVFEVRHRKGMVRPNPRTGEAMECPPVITIGFLPSAAVRNRLNGRRP